ncbi:AcvB/VirJ family lysyl-phosphatidylglycerol hydrolase [Lysobacter firmicutimachus]|uniref:AcvB/VirJ family lysyl-phosphatidylglycerol hydrolase n=1 Tax=Lysobacter firmicutimachus TaxID=1792846 RepID=A0AAU8MX07_9GAMM
MPAPIRFASFLLCLLCALVAGAAVAAPAAATVSHGRFQRATVRLPAGEVRRVVLWFAGDGDARARRARLEALAGDGALVAQIDLRALQAALRRDGGDCAFSAGDVENFSRFLQAYYRLPTYRLPLLLGDGEGAAWAYAIAAQGHAGLFAGAVSEGFCPSIAPARALCAGGALRLRADGAYARLQAAPLSLPWLVAADPAQARACTADEVERFVAAVPQARRFARSARGDATPGLRAALIALGAQRHVSLPPPPPDLHGLPLVEAAAAAGGNADSFAIFVSGDGGWADFDRSVAARLGRAGVPTVGVDSLRYFWTPRTPQSFAADLERIVRYYRAQWRRPRVLLIGFSQGADVLPAAYNRLAPDVRAAVRGTALISPGQKAEYEFHLSNWIGGSDRGLPIAPEVARMPAARTLCLYGRDDGDALCPRLPAQAAQRAALPGDHHLGSDYDGVAARVLSAAGIAAPAASAAP